MHMFANYKSHFRKFKSDLKILKKKVFIVSLINKSYYR